MYSREEEDSDEFGFEDEDDDDITESKDISSSAASSKKNKFQSFATKSSAPTNTGPEVDIDLFIKKLLSVKVRNIGISDEVTENQII